MNYTVGNGVDRSADRRSQINAVVEVPDIFIDAGTVRRIHLVRLGCVTQGPDERLDGHAESFVCVLLCGRDLRHRAVGAAEHQRAVLGV
jgi:hypothetical protein